MPKCERFDFDTQEEVGEFARTHGLQPLFHGPHHYIATHENQITVANVTKVNGEDWEEFHVSLTRLPAEAA